MSEENKKLKKSKHTQKVKDKQHSLRRTKENSISLQFTEKSAQVKQRLLQEIRTLSSLILMKVEQQSPMKDQM